jgi:hypothetical protein
MTKVFLPITESPLLAGRADSADAELAVLLARTAAPEPHIVSALLSITVPDVVADRITAALGEREDLRPTALARLVAERPHLKKATARLKNILFPSGKGACHTFTRTIAALAHHPETLDHTYLTGGRFQHAAAAADPAALHDLLRPLLESTALPGPADTGLAALLTARNGATAPTDFDRAGAASRDRTRRTRLLATLTQRRQQTIQEVAEHTGGLTLTAEHWFDALTEAAETPQQVGQALALATLAGPALRAGSTPDCPWPTVRRRWHQLAATHSADHTSPVWGRAWENTATTADGSRWDPTQRTLVASYDLLAEHVRTTYTHTEAAPSPDLCWAADPAGRNLLHLVADHLTGHLGHSPLPHFDDTLLYTFIRALAKNRRDQVPGALHIHGLIAAIKAARSKATLITRPTRTDLGIVVPVRGETHRLRPTGPGDDAITTKVAQLSWLLNACPDAHAEILLVDEADDSASAHAAQRIRIVHPQIRLTATTRPDPASAKGGAVLWGLQQLLHAGHTTVTYTDLDLTYPLDQLGLHLAALDHPDTGAVIGSRRLADSHGYYPPTGPTPATRLYQRTVHELLNLDVTDPQAGFKTFDAGALRTALPHVTDHSLAFDTELLTAIQASGYGIVETGTAALYRYVDGQVGTPRDYDVMLAAVHEQAVRHGLDPEQRATPTWDRIRQAGSLTAAADAATRGQHVDITLIPGPH